MSNDDEKWDEKLASRLKKIFLTSIIRLNKACLKIIVDKKVDIGSILLFSQYIWEVAAVVRSIKDFISEELNNVDTVIIIADDVNETLAEIAFEFNIVVIYTCQIAVSDFISSIQFDFTPNCVLSLSTPEIDDTEAFELATEFKRRFQESKVYVVSNTPELQEDKENNIGVVNYTPSILASILLDSKQTMKNKKTRE